MRKFLLLILFLVLFAALRYLAVFTGTQSLVLSLMLCLLFGFIVERTAERLPFVPYFVLVKPNWKAILEDFGFLNDPEDWGKLWREIEKLPEPSQHIWNIGFYFSIVRSGLVFVHGSNTFSTNSKMCATLAPLAMAWRGSADLTPRPPYLYLEQDGEGYHLRFEVLKSHWEKIRNSDPFKGISYVWDFYRLKEFSYLNMEDDLSSGIVKVQVAVIPYEEFGVHFWVRPGDSGKAYRNAIKRRSEARSLYDWAGSDSSNVIEHKYFTVKHSAL